MPWSIRLVIVWAIAALVVGVGATVLDSPDPGGDARAWGRLIGERIILSLLTLAVLGLVIGRVRWVANVILTAQAAVAIAASPTPDLETAFSTVAWLLLLSPSAQQFLARAPRDSSTPPRLPAIEWLRILGTALASGLLPGSGQVCNRTYRRAAVQLVIWASAWITHLRPVWTLACLYSMCEAGWTAAALAHARRRTPTNPVTKAFDMEIRTPRLLLRPMDQRDAAGYGELLSDPRIHPFVVENGPVPPEDVPERIARKQLLHADGSAATWSLLRDDEFVGYVAIHGLGNPRVAMSYALLVSAQGLGLGREAVAGVLEHAEELGFAEVEARTHLDNEVSVRLLLAAGFVEGEPWATPARRVFVWTARESETP